VDHENMLFKTRKLPGKWSKVEEKRRVFNDMGNDRKNFVDFCNQRYSRGRIDLVEITGGRLFQTSGEINDEDFLDPTEFFYSAIEVYSEILRRTRENYVKEDSLKLKLKREENYHSLKDLSAFQEVSLRYAEKLIGGEEVF
jgi:hypothetical protein